MDRALKREFHEPDPTVMARLTHLYKQRLAAASGSPRPSDPKQAASAAPADSAQLLWPSPSPPVAASTSPATAAAAALAHVSSSTATPRHAAGIAALLGGPPPQIIPLADSARPEAMDPSAWDRFVEFRIARARLEITACDAASKAQRAARQVAVLEARAAALASDADAAAAEAAAIRAARTAACMDVELRFGLKAGQVEAEAEGISALLQGAVMVKRETVESLNEVVRSKGRQKMELLGQMKEFKKGIYSLQWENKRCVLFIWGWSWRCTGHRTYYTTAAFLPLPPPILTLPKNSLHIYKDRDGSRRRSLPGPRAPAAPRHQGLPAAGQSRPRRQGQRRRQGGRQPRGAAAHAGRAAQEAAGGGAAEGAAAGAGDGGQGAAERRGRWGRGHGVGCSLFGVVVSGLGAECRLQIDDKLFSAQ